MGSRKPKSVWDVPLYSSESKPQHKWKASLTTQGLSQEQVAWLRMALQRIRGLRPEHLQNMRWMAPTSTPTNLVGLYKPQVATHEDTVFISPGALPTTVGHELQHARDARALGKLLTPGAAAEEHADMTETYGLQAPPMPYLRRLPKNPTLADTIIIRLLREPDSVIPLLWLLGSHAAAK